MGWIVPPDRWKVDQIDPADRLLIDFARRHPVRWGFLMYLTGVGTAAIVAEFVVPRLRESLRSRFLMPLLMLTPHVVGTARSWWRGVRLVRPAETRSGDSLQSQE